MSWYRCRTSRWFLGLIDIVAHESIFHPKMVIFARRNSGDLNRRICGLEFLGL